MNRAGLAIAAIGLTLAGSRAAEAQTIITPVELAADAPYFVFGFSVSALTSTLAFNVQETVGGFTVDNIWTVSPLGNAGQNVTNFPSLSDGVGIAPAWSPNPELLAYIDVPFRGSPDPHPSSRLVVDVFGPITPDSLSVTSFSWAPDGSSLVFSAFERTVATGGPNLYTISPAGLGLKQIRACAEPCQNPQWHPVDIDLIAYETQTNGTTSIALINPAGTALRTILPNASSPTWSPSTGQMLTYVCGTDICVANEDGSGQRNLTGGASGFHFSSGSWSLDESLIAVAGVPPGAPFGFGNLYVITPSGGPLQQWTTTLDGASPQWSPLSSDLFYRCLRRSNGDLCEINGPAPSTGGCDPATCNGCCLQGQCLAGNTDVACGVPGGTCQACSGQTSCDPVAHRCLPVGGCDFSSCGGCCGSDGLCHSGRTSDACGAQGESCATCQGTAVCSPTQTCRTPTTCDSTTCNGCCDASHFCHTGVDPLVCGKGGRLCVACPSAAVCDPAQGVCTTPVCTSANCKGCCGADGHCQAGTTNLQCGANGFSCTTCSSGTQCSGSHVCQSVAACSATSCPTGCCDATGVCRPGNSPDACGYGGFACISCGGLLCDANAHTCNPPSLCTSSNCQGCCGPADGQCHPGVRNDACGFSGFNCEVCQTGQQCDSGAHFCI